MNMMLIVAPILVASVLPDAFDALLHAAGHLHQPALLVSLPERSLVHLHSSPSPLETETVPISYPDISGVSG